MQHRRLSLCGLLWATLTLFYSWPVKADTAGDIRSLAQTIVARIQGFQFGPVGKGVNIPGLESIPGEQPVESLEAAEESLEIFLQILSKLPGQNLAGQAISNDMKNLQSLLRLLSSELGCPVRSPSGEEASGGDSNPRLSELLATYPFTIATVTFHRLQMFLQSIDTFMDQVKPC